MRPYCIAGGMLVALLLGMLAGCGGGGGTQSVTNPPGTGAVTFTFNWPTASGNMAVKDFDLSAANSLRITVGEQSAVLHRPETSITITGVSVGQNVPFRVAAFTSTDASGNVIAESGGTTVVAEGATPPAGVPATAIVANPSAIDHLVMFTSIEVNVGNTASLGLGAMNDEGAYLLIPASAVSLQNSNSTVATIQDDRTIKGLQKGTTTVTASYPGVPSVSCAVTVHSGITLTIATPSSMTMGGTQTLHATLANSTAGVHWTVVEENGGSIGLTTGVYTAPMTPGTYHVRATSVDDDDVSSQCAITVTGSNGTVVIQ